KLIANLQKLADNAAETSSNLRKVTGELSNPATIASLRETLDSARATFANAKKITADLDEITGDPKLRSNIRNLINGLGGLLSTAPNLDNVSTASNSRTRETATEKLPTSVEVSRSKEIKPVSDDREKREKSLEHEKVKINSPSPTTTISKTTSKSRSSLSTEASNFESSIDQ
ncbi:MAG: MCE family protein, partial [Pseudanabaena sp.]